MHFQLKEMILWPRKVGLEPRRLSFTPGMVNVISGISRTGKSAVIPIIDYCLGARSCAIPVETIRKATAWFGVLVECDGTTRLFARKEPAEQRVTDEMMVLEGTDIAIPIEPSRNATADGVRRMLDELSGLSNLDFGDEQSGPFAGRVSFRDLAAFTFQPQNVIANPEVLFFKTDSYEHREKLRNIFPYVLGAVTPDTLAKQHELRRLQQQLKRKQRELTELEKVSAEWVARLQARIAEARELGLLHNLPQNASQDEMIAALEAITQREDVSSEITPKTVEDASREAVGLEQEERHLSADMSVLRQRLTEMNRVRAGASSYAGALTVQRNRLKIAEWVGAHEPGQCPICGGSQAPAAEALAELTEALKDIEASLGDFQQLPASFDRELQRVRVEVEEVAERLKGVRIRQKALAARSNIVRAEQYRARQADRFIGNTAGALELHRRIRADAGLRDEVAQLQENVDKLDAEVRAEDVQKRTERAVKQVNALAGAIVPALDAERPSAPIELEIRDLTVKVVGPDRVDHLSEIGSGSNWLSYHLAVSLALHQYFLTLKASPVPTFLVIDQPSQVYFPRKLAIRADEAPIEPDWKEDADVAAVKKIFAAIGQIATAAKGALQIIVLDHAPPSIWGDLPGITLVEEWRDGDSKLVPSSWL